MSNAIGPKFEQISLVHTALDFEELVVKLRVRIWHADRHLRNVRNIVAPRRNRHNLGNFSGEGTLFQLTETRSGLGLELSLGVGLELKVYGAGSRVEGSRLRVYGVGF